MDASSLSDVLQMGGVLTFATVVYFQLKEQTRIFRDVGDTLVRIAERQVTIMERQATIAMALDIELERVKARR